MGCKQIIVPLALSRLLSRRSAVIGKSMTDVPTPQDLEILAVRAGISVAEACRRAGLVPDVFTRWKRGKSNPSIENVRGIVRELECAVAERGLV